MSGEATAKRRLGLAWLLLCAAVAAHVADEALTGFLSVYNPTVLTLRQRLGWWPMPAFTYEGWLSGLIVGIVILFLLSPLAFGNARGFRPLAYVFAVLMTLNGVGHTVGTIAGRTFESIPFARPMPGFYSSPFLIAASIWVLVELRRSAGSRGNLSMSNPSPFA